MPAARRNFSELIWTALPMPTEPNEIVPGLALASAMKSCRVFQFRLTWPGLHHPEAAVREIALDLGMGVDLERLVGTLSGGEQQRVALGRCLLRKASVCLLDEPLGHLDAPLRTELRRRIRTLARRLSVPWFSSRTIPLKHSPWAIASR